MARFYAHQCMDCETSYKVNPKTELCEICTSAKAAGIQRDGHKIDFANAMRIHAVIDEAHEETYNKMPYMKGVWISPHKLHLIAEMLRKIDHDLREAASMEAARDIQYEKAMNSPNDMLAAIVGSLEDEDQNKDIKDIALGISLRKADTDGKYMKKQHASEDTMRDFVQNTMLESAYDGHNQ